MAILNVLFYLDARREVLLITLCFFITNLLFTFATLELGAETFGYGFAASVITLRLSRPIYSFAQIQPA